MLRPTAILCANQLTSRVLSDLDSGLALTRAPE